jgi:hypothetical protein
MSTCPDSLDTPCYIKRPLIMAVCNPRHECIFVEVLACLCDKVIIVSD